ncbi:hypothetical protein [Chryseobacterium sp. A301]
MKSKLLLLALPAVLLFSCSKTEGNKGIVVADSQDTISTTAVDSVNLSYTMEPGTFRYVAFDGSNTNVTFATENGGNTITLKSNQLTLTVPQVDSKDNEAIYKDHDIEIRAFGDSIVLDQGDNVIELKKARGQD